MLREVGRLVALLHDGGMVHGDLTTSNMMLRDSDGALVCREGSAPIAKFPVKRAMRG
jgi:TP53 regulating kinase-like protein